MWVTQERLLLVEERKEKSTFAAKLADMHGYVCVVMDWLEDIWTA